MADSDLQVKFGASTDEAIAGIDQIKAALENFSSPVQSAISAFASLGKAVIGAFAIDKIAEFAGEYAELGEQVERTSAMLGVSTKSVQELSFIALEAGGSSEAMASAIERLQLNLQRAQNSTSQQALALRALGLSARDLIGVPVPEQMARLADSFARFADGPNKTAIAMELIGRTGAQLIPILDQGRSGLQTLTQAADESGAVMSKQTVGALAELQRSLTAFKAQLTGITGTMVGEFAPALSRMVEGFSTLIGNINAAVQSGTFWQQEMIGLSTDAAELWQALKNLGTIAKDVFTLNWGAIAADRQAGFDRVAEIQREGEAKIAAIAQQAKAQLQQILSGAPEVEKPQAPAIPILDTNALKASLERYQEMLKSASDAFTQFQNKQQFLAKTGQISQDQETSNLLAALGRRRDAETAALDGELLLYARGTAEYEKAIAKRKELDDQYWKERQKLEQDGLQKDAQAWSTMLAPIESAWNSQLRGILSGQESFATASKKIFADLIINIIQGFEKAAMEKAALGLASLFGAPAGAATGGIGGALFAGIGSIFGFEKGAWDVPAFAGGAWEIPSAAGGMWTMGGGGGGLMAMLHPKEAVLPAAAAQGFRSLSEGRMPGRGGDDVADHMERQTRIMQRMADRHADSLATITKSHVRATSSLESQIDQLTRKMRR